MSDLDALQRESLRRMWAGEQPLVADVRIGERPGWEERVADAILAERGWSRTNANVEATGRMARAALGELPVSEEDVGALVSCALALAHLVALKDGPRDGAYEASKPGAWDQAREANARFQVALAESITDTPEHYRLPSRGREGVYPPDADKQESVSGLPAEEREQYWAVEGGVVWHSRSSCWALRRAHSEPFRISKPEADELAGPCSRCWSVPRSAGVPEQAEEGR